MSPRLACYRTLHPLIFPVAYDAWTSVSTVGLTSLSNSYADSLILTHTDSSNNGLDYLVTIIGSCLPYCMYIIRYSYRTQPLPQPLGFYQRPGKGLLIKGVVLAQLIVHGSSSSISIPSPSSSTPSSDIPQVHSPSPHHHPSYKSFASESRGRWFQAPARRGRLKLDLRTRFRLQVVPHQRREGE